MPDDGPRWAAIWDRAVAQYNQTVATSYHRQQKAASYAASQLIREDGGRRAAALAVQPDWTVLDIGSGPGTLALPLAPRVAEVICVEPSAAMNALLAAGAARLGIDNIRTIEQPWEAVPPQDLPPCEVVVASYSLAMPDIAAALRRMDAVATRRVHLFWFAGPTAWTRFSTCLYPAVHGRAYAPMPGCDVLYNVLYELGLYADVRVLHGTAFPRRYPDVPSAVDDLRLRLGVEHRDGDGLLEEYVRAHYRFTGSEVVWDDDTHYVELSWRPQG